MTTTTPPYLGDLTLVQITLGEDDATVSWSVFKDLLCQHSKYFHKAFNFDGTEKASSIHHLPDDAGVTESTVNIFLRWLYYQRIQFEDGKYTLDDSNLNQALELYIFADRYDTLLLRRACIDLLFGYICIRRDRQGTLRSRARLWSPEFMDKVHDSLPESSPLSRMIADDEVSHVEFESAEEAADWIEKTPAKLVGESCSLFR